MEFSVHTTQGYISYLLQKYAPVRNATLVPAILGGIYSSTATTVVLAKRQREAAAVRSDFAAGIAAATAMMYLRLEIIIAVFNWRFAWALAPAMGTLFAVGAALAIYEWRRNTKRQADSGLQIPAINPLQIPAAMIFAAIFVVSLAKPPARRSEAAERIVLQLHDGLRDVGKISAAALRVEGVAIGTRRHQTADGQGGRHSLQDAP